MSANNYEEQQRWLAGHAHVARQEEERKQRENEERARREREEAQRREEEARRQRGW